MGEQRAPGPAHRTQGTAAPEPARAGGNPEPALADAGIASDRPLYAVLRAGEQAPPGARRLYVNDRFALYELRAP